ncbi:hypothetical protein [Corynebacterium crudilactis]|uniref:Uncharacterized protein n=1 Tax=Corynebacterium crudilactis TaxID=1652495 RepID=A0A172QXZ7_9CORY|nr:hypothetical protein [Corynebacterium crudilactis]ANE05516.1 hypothetical protein ccrud_14340 [Corynebacterium crudilactis]
MTAQGFIEDLLAEAPELVAGRYRVTRNETTIVVEDWVEDGAPRFEEEWRNPHGYKITLEEMESAADQWAEETLTHWEDQEPEDLKSAMAYTKKNFDLATPSENIAVAVFSFATNICAESWVI